MQTLLVWTLLSISFNFRSPWFLFSRHFKTLALNRLYLKVQEIEHCSLFFFQFPPPPKKIQDWFFQRWYVTHSSSSCSIIVKVVMEQFVILLVPINTSMFSFITTQLLMLKRYQYSFILLQKTLVNTKGFISVFQVPVTITQNRYSDQYQVNAKSRPVS